MTLLILPEFPNSRMWKICTGSWHLPESHVHWGLCFLHIHAHHSLTASLTFTKCLAFNLVTIFLHTRKLLSVVLYFQENYFVALGQGEEINPPPWDEDAGDQLRTFMKPHDLSPVQASLRSWFISVTQQNDKVQLAVGLLNRSGKLKTSKNRSTNPVQFLFQKVL